MSNEIEKTVEENTTPVSRNFIEEIKKSHNCNTKTKASKRNVSALFCFSLLLLILLSIISVEVEKWQKCL